MICCLDLNRTRTRIIIFSLQTSKTLFTLFEFSVLMLTQKYDRPIKTLESEIRQFDWSLRFFFNLLSNLFSQRQGNNVQLFDKPGKKGCLSNKDKKLLSTVKDKNIIKICCVQQLSHWKKAKKMSKREVIKLKILVRVISKQELGSRYQIKDKKNFFKLFCAKLKKPKEWRN